MNKFENLNGKFTSLRTGMTQQYKFRNRCWTLLYFYDKKQATIDSIKSLLGEGMLIYLFAPPKDTSPVSQQFRRHPSGREFELSWERILG
jgi:hypothetical protein